MIRPRNVWLAFVAAIGLLAGVFTIGAQIQGFGPLINNLIALEFSLNLLIGILVVFVSVLLPSVSFYNLLFTARKNHQKAVDELNARLENSKRQLNDVESKLRKSELDRMTDMVAQIPNQAQFHIDLERVAKAKNSASDVFMIFIDLIEFSRVNNEFGYQLGDDIIHYFAQSIYESMRRNEELYKLPFDEPLENGEYWKRAYRKYTGGDEFIILISGSEAEAVGFLVRLEKRIREELNPHIQKNILGSASWSLNFSAAILPIHARDTKEDVFQRAHEGMRIARQPGHKSRVFWASRTQSKDIADGHWSKHLYEKAEQMFKV